MVDWATPDDVDELTGEAVEVRDIKKAQAIVGLFAGITTDSSDQGLVSGRNLRLLSSATAWQAVWMQDHPDIYTAMDAKSVSQDGVSGTLDHANAHLLAPLAKRCIDRLTWSTEPLRARPARRAGQPVRGSLDSAAFDDTRDWDPM